MLLIYLYGEGIVSCKTCSQSNCIYIDNKIIIKLKKIQLIICNQKYVEYHQQYMFIILHCNTPIKLTKYQSKYILIDQKLHTIPFHSEWNRMEQHVCYKNSLRFWSLRFMVFNATFNNISAISWRSILLVEESGVPRENHKSPTNCIP